MGCPFQTWGNWGSQSLNHWLKIPRVVSSRVRTWTHTSELYYSSYLNSMHIPSLPITELDGAMFSNLDDSELAGLGGFPSKCSDLQVLGLRLRICILTSSRVMLILLIWGPHSRSTSPETFPSCCVDPSKTLCPRIQGLGLGQQAPLQEVLINNDISASNGYYHHQPVDGYSTLVVAQGMTHLLEFYRETTNRIGRFIIRNWPTWLWRLGNPKVCSLQLWRAHGIILVQRLLGWEPQKSQGFNLNLKAGKDQCPSSQ